MRQPASNLLPTGFLPSPQTPSARDAHACTRAPARETAPAGSARTAAISLDDATLSTSIGRCGFGAEVRKSDGASLVLGVDLGTQGAVALVEATGDLVAVEDLPVLPDGPRARPHINAAVLADLLRSWQPSRAFVEFVGARPTDSRVGAFSFGMARGNVDGVLATLAIPVRTITAPTWKRVIGIPAGAGQKSTARAEATRRWPQHAALFARVRDDGRAEAALIAVAGMAREAQGR